MTFMTLEPFSITSDWRELHSKHIVLTLWLRMTNHTKSLIFHHRLRAENTGVRASWGRVDASLLIGALAVSGSEAIYNPGHVKPKSIQSTTTTNAPK